MNKHRKLTDEQACELVAAYLDGTSSHELADDYGISPPAVVNYVRRAGAQPRSREENLARGSKLPGAAKLALSIRRDGATLEGLAAKYEISASRLRSRLNDAGFSSLTGEPTIKSVEHRTSPLILSAGGSAHHVGGGDYDRGLPGVDMPAASYKSRKPQSTGLDWDALRPKDEPLTPSSPDILMNHTGHTFQADPVFANDDEGSRVVSRHRRAPAASAARRTTDRTSTRPKPRRGGPAGKLTPAQRTEIVARYAEGESSSQLAKAYGVSAAAICYTIKRAGGQIRTRSQAMQLVWR